MCDFAVGLSRQLNGSIIPSERTSNLLELFFHSRHFLWWHVGCSRNPAIRKEPLFCILSTE